MHAAQRPPPGRQLPERAAPDLGREDARPRPGDAPLAKAARPGRGPPGPDELARAAAAFGRRYDGILDLAEAEYGNSPPTDYCRDGYNLYRRLRRYRDSELRFLAHPEVEPDNSLCERLARVFKRKQRQAVVFRGFRSLGHTCEVVSAVTNMRLSGEGVFSGTSAIFNRPKSAPAPSETAGAAG